MKLTPEVLKQLKAHNEKFAGSPPSPGTSPVKHTSAPRTKLTETPKPAPK